MRRWAFVVALRTDPRSWDLPWQTWATLLVTGVAQTLLLLVPVKVESRRPITRRSLIPPVLQRWKRIHPREQSPAGPPGS